MTYRDKLTYKTLSVLAESRGYRLDRGKWGAGYHIRVPGDWESGGYFRRLEQAHSWLLENPPAHALPKLPVDYDGSPSGRYV